MNSVLSQSTMPAVTNDSKSINKKLEEILLLIAEYYTMNRDTFRAKSFRNASKKIANFHSPIVSGSQARKDINGIGKSIEQVIDEYISTGSVQRLVDLESKFMDRKDIIDLFLSIYGIGPVSAVRFYNEGYRTLEDLWNSEELNDKQELGFIWREHINLRIPRDEIDIIKEHIGMMLNYHIKWEIAGSYRREELSSGDIDMLVESAHGFDMERLLFYLQSVLPVTLASGPTKFMGMIRLSEESNARRIDIRLVEPEHLPFALMYFTGSQKFNILIRQRAIDLRLSLNEYSLTDVDGLCKDATTEKDIFEILGVKYISPVDRIKDLNCLEFI